VSGAGHAGPAEIAKMTVKNRRKNPFQGGVSTPVFPQNRCAYPAAFL